MKTQLLLLSGKAGVGKDTTCDIIQDMVGDELIQVHRYAFAGILKQVCTLLFQLDDDSFTDRFKKETIVTRFNLTPRQIAQWFGTEVMRNQFSKTFWIDRLEYEIKRNLNNEKENLVVITDARFPNEIEEMQKRFEKTALICIEREETSKTETKQSETTHTLVQQPKIKPIATHSMMLNICKLLFGMEEDAFDKNEPIKRYDNKTPTDLYHWLDYTIMSKQFSETFWIDMEIGTKRIQNKLEGTFDSKTHVSELGTDDIKEKFQHILLENNGTIHELTMELVDILIPLNLLRWG